MFGLAVSIPLIMAGAALVMALLERFAELSANVDSKYDWSMDESWELWEIAPATVIAYDLTDFPSSPTRFRFGEG